MTEIEAAEIEIEDINVNVTEQKAQYLANYKNSDEQPIVDWFKEDVDMYDVNDTDILYYHIFHNMAYEGIFEPVLMKDPDFSEYIFELATNDSDFKYKLAKYYLENSKYDLLETLLMGSLDISMQQQNIIEEKAIMNFVFDNFKENTNIVWPIQFFLKAIEKNSIVAMVCFGKYCMEKKDIQNAEKYYKLAIENGSLASMFWLGILFHETDVPKAIKYYLMYISQENLPLPNFCTSANHNLAILMKNEERWDELVDCYLNSLQSGSNQSNIVASNNYLSNHNDIPNLT